MSDTQKKAIGLVGEVCARKWIALTHSIDVDESVWVSRYRDAVLITGGGSDLLGYDFVVATKSRTYYYEVKASSGDPRRFEMGPTEIGSALRYKADRDHRYRILYIAFATDPARTQATLPRPTGLSLPSPEVENGLCSSVACVRAGSVAKAMYKMRYL